MREPAHAYQRDARPLRPSLAARLIKTIVAPIVVQAAFARRPLSAMRGHVNASPLVVNLPLVSAAANPTRTTVVISAAQALVVVEAMFAMQDRVSRRRSTVHAVQVRGFPAGAVFQ